MTGFKKFDHTRIKDLAAYIREWKYLNPRGTIAVGTDSTVHKTCIVYATVIGLFYDNKKGAHLLYRRHRVPGKLALFNRLWNEITYTFDVLEFIKNEVGIKGEPHIDINDDEHFGSNVAYAASVGFFRSAGYNAVAKPDAFVASCAADLKLKGHKKKRAFDAPIGKLD